MLLPIGDEPRLANRTAWMTLALIGANIACYGFTRLEPRGAFEALLERRAFDPAAPELRDLFAAMFLHWTLLHLAGNMLFLWIFGRGVERRLGPWLFLAAYLVVGCLATGTHALVIGEPVLGASGAVSGVLGLYFVACRGHRILVLFWLYFFITVLRVNARIVMLFWFLMQDGIPLLVQWRTGEADRVAHWAHLGGFVAGVGLMLVLARILPPERDAPEQPTEA